jgi:histidine triad (HIT) family protein
MSCLFCNIAAKEKDAAIIYEDAAVVALLDIFPCTEGHTVLIPKRHMKNLLEMRDEELEPFWKAARVVAGMLKERLSPDGFTIGVNHDKVAGQAIDHLHLHIIPRYEGDGGGSMHSVVKQKDQKTVEEVFSNLRINGQ